MAEDKKLTGYPSVDRPWLKFFTEENINSEIENISAYEQLYFRCSKLGRKCAIQYYFKSISFGQLFQKINLVAGFLKKIGAKSGDVISVSLPNIPEAIYIFYAINKIGAIANMIDCRADAQRMDECIRSGQSKILFVLSEQLEACLNIAEESGLTDIIPIRPTQALFPFLHAGKHLSNGLRKSHKCKIHMNMYRTLPEETTTSPGSLGNAPAVYEHTSGTTGTSKVVILTNLSFTGIVNGYENFGIDTSQIQRFLNLIPPFMAYGIIASTHMPLAMGWSVRLIPKFEEEKFYDQLMKYRPHMTNATVMHWKCAKRRAEKKPSSDFSFLVAGGVGGDMIDPVFEEEMRHFLQAHGCENYLCKGYGMTEVGSTFTCSNGLNPHGYGSVGIPFVKNAIMVCDEEGNELSYNQTGELYLSGPTMMIGYLNDRKLTEETRVYKSGVYWIKTGDLAKINEDGELTIVGRIKRLIITNGGEKIIPRVIEKVISEHPAVVDVCVVGVNDRIRVCVPKAHIIINKQFRAKEQKVLDQIKELCDSRLAAYYRPVYYQIDQDFPLTPVGKVDYRALEKEDENLYHDSK